MLVEDFRSLRVYKAAFQAALDIFERTKRWPREEQYALIDQIRRASRSVCQNIAEAWCKRRYPRHFASKLSDASAEAAETLVLLDFTVACGYETNTTLEDLRRKYEEVLGGLVRMMAAPERWCPPSLRVKEGDAPYDAGA